ncbi:hypothetical protein [Mycolicibacterium nivoides]
MTTTRAPEVTRSLSHDRQSPVSGGAMATHGFEAFMRFAEAIEP